MAILNLKIPPRDLKAKDARRLLAIIFSQWLSLSTCVIQTVIDIVPAPTIAQANRIPIMLYPDFYEQTMKPKSKLEEDLFTSNHASDACVSAYVSKMFAVSGKDFARNKNKVTPADEMRSMARQAREANTAAHGPSDHNNTSLGDVNLVLIPQTPPSEEPPVHEGSEIIFGFARLYSGTIRVGTSVYCVLPKYKMSLGPTHPQNAKYIVTASVDGLYVMMGRELVPVDSVRAGNTFAIKGLEGKVWRSATLCAPGEVGAGQNPDIVIQKDCLINLGGVNRSVGVCVAGCLGLCAHYLCTL